MVLEQNEECEITDMSVNKLILRCEVSCEGEVELSGPSGWGSGIKKVASGGGAVQKEIPLSGQYSGKYKCKYMRSETSTVEQTVTVDPLCSTEPTLSASTTLPWVGQRLVTG